MNDLGHWGERPPPKFHEKLFFQLYTFFRGTPSTLLIVLVPNNEHPTLTKRLIFSPPKPPFRCKVTPLTLHSLYVEVVQSGVTKAGNALHQADKKIRAPGLCRHRRGGDTAICRRGNETGEK